MKSKTLYVLAGLLLGIAGSVVAQSYPKWGGSMTGIVDYNGNQFSSANPFPVANSSSQPAVKGFGTLAATNASTLLSTLTTGPSSAAFSTTGMLFVINAPASAGTVYVCPLGGTCSATVGIPIAAGGAYGFYQPASTITVYAASTATVVAQW